VAEPTYETILYDVADGIATITLNRPERLNAFTGQMMVDMIAAFDAIDADDAVRVVIVTGAGRGFCAGADLAAGGDTFDRTGPQDPSRESGRVGDVLRDGGGRRRSRSGPRWRPGECPSAAAWSRRPAARRWASA
jgi:enoyl-CoA hydratase/carnithine racemase